MIVLVDTQRIHARHLGVSAPLLFALGAGSMYFGAALAVLLFDRLSPAGVAWLRILVAALASGAGVISPHCCWPSPGWCSSLTRS